MYSVDIEPNIEERLEKLEQDFENPFSPPIDVMEQIPKDYPALDTGIDGHEWYDVGATIASVTDIIENKTVTKLNHPEKDPKKMAMINAEWHAKNKMPKNPTTQQRLKWHREHLKNCACRKPTPAIQKLLDEDN